MDFPVPKGSEMPGRPTTADLFLKVVEDVKRLTESNNPEDKAAFNKICSKGKSLNELIGLIGHIHNASLFMEGIPTSRYENLPTGNFRMRTIRSMLYSLYDYFAKRLDKKGFTGLGAEMAKTTHLKDSYGPVSAQMANDNRCKYGISRRGSVPGHNYISKAPAHDIMRGMNLVQSLLNARDFNALVESIQRKERETLAHALKETSQVLKSFCLGRCPKSVLTANSWPPQEKEKDYLEVYRSSSKIVLSTREQDFVTVLL
jgi:hypothetical protein